MAVAYIFLIYYKLQENYFKIRQNDYLQNYLQVEKKRMLYFISFSFPDIKFCDRYER